jgi:hypothetical protein
VTRTTTTRLIAKPKDGPGKKYLVFIFLFEEINALKRQLNPEKTASSKRGRLNTSSLLKLL